MSNSNKPGKKQKRQGEDLVHFADKIYHFRRDVLKEKDIRELRESRDYVKQALQTGSGELMPAINRLHDVCQRLGGKIYPRNFWNENVEMFLGAVIVVLALRVFFAQPFIIPTNSMYPSFNGLTWRIYDEQEEGPGLVGKIAGLVTQGARHRSMVAPASGEVFIPVYEDNERRPDGRGLVKYDLVRGRIFGVWPGTVREYTLFVGPRKEPVKVRVPRDFAMDQLLVDALYGGRRDAFRPEWVQERGGSFLSTGKVVEAGDPILRFDILLGDMLLVDRMSYHFVKPKVGDPFVFKTINIDGLRGPGGQPEDKYYIKRLVGTPGDSLEIRPPVLFRNGEPIEGSVAFEYNANREGEYEGYIHTNPVAYAAGAGILVPDGAMRPGQTVRIPEASYYAMGDNSDQSLDSRSWGFVPEQAVIGRAIFIYYPFTRRWGLTK